MKVSFDNNKLLFIFLTFCLLTWRIFLIIPLAVGYKYIAQIPHYIGKTPWSNFDGSHYLEIAAHGYIGYQQAFFPFFPLLINYSSKFMGHDLVHVSLFLTHGFFLIALFFFWKLMRLDYSQKTSIWIIIFVFVFPTAFYFASVYTESLFFALVISSLYFARKKQFLLACIIAGLASATRIVGLFIIIPLIIEIYNSIQLKKIHSEFIKSYLPLVIIPFGLIAYMIYLHVVYADPLMFMHVQPGFGAGRSGGEIILIPQVLWRYFKILMTVSHASLTFWVAILELASFIGSIIVLLFALRKKIRLSYILFSISLILFPSLSGTLSSIPRYIIIVFPLYIFFALLDIKIRIQLIIVFSTIQIILASLFLRGYFIS